MHSRRSIKQRERTGLRITSFNGGGRAARVLPGLTRIAEDMCANINVADNGKDSVEMRDGLRWAPGDVRRALVAMAANPDTLMTRLFAARLDGRFPSRAGQSFGNSFFAAALTCGLDTAGQIMGGGPGRGAAGQPEGAAPRLRRHGSHERHPAQHGAEVARPRLALHDRHLRGRGWRRGEEHRQSYVVKQYCPNVSRGRLPSHGIRIIG